MNIREHRNRKGNFSSVAELPFLLWRGGGRNRGAAIEKNALFYCSTLPLRRPAVEKGAPQLEGFYTVPKKLV